MDCGLLACPSQFREWQGKRDLPQALRFSAAGSSLRLKRGTIAPKSRLLGPKRKGRALVAQRTPNSKCLSGEDYIFGASLEALEASAAGAAEASAAGASEASAVASVVASGAGASDLQAERAKTPATAAARTILRIYGIP